MALSMELRTRILRARDQGQSIRKVAERFMVGTRTVERLLARRQATGDVVPGTSPGRPRKLSPEQTRALEAAVAARPDATLAELRKACGVDGSLTLIHNALARLGLSRKKSRCGPSNAIAPTS